MVTNNKSLATALAVSFALLLLVLIEPLGSGNAVLHSMALDLVRYGRLPYIGSWDNNFPGIIFLHAIDILLLGASATAFRVFDVLIQLLFVAFLYKFSSRWLKPHAAALTAVLYVAYYVSGDTYLYGQQDGYGMMMVLVGTSLILPRRDGRCVGFAQTILGGLLAGFSLLMRPTFLLFIAILGLYLLFWVDNGRMASRLPKAVLFVLSALLPMGAFLFYYSTIPGGLEAFYTATIRFNLDLYTMLSGGILWIEIVRSGLMIPLAISAIAFKATRRPEIFGVVPSKKEIGLFIAFVAAGLFIVLYMGKYWRYQFAPFYISLVPFAAIGIEQLMLRAKEGLPRHYVMVGCVLLSSFIAYNPLTPVAYAFALLEHKNPGQMAEDARRPSPLYGSKPERPLLAYLEKPENQSGTIEYCGFEPYFRLDLRRPFFGRYTTFHSLAFRTDATNIGPPHYTDYQQKWQADYVRQLEQAKPRFIVLGRGMNFWYIQDIYTDCLTYLPGFDPFFKSSYRYDTAFGGFQVYQYAK